MGQVNWPANERQWIDTSETHGWLAGGVNRGQANKDR